MTCNVASKGNAPKANPAETMAHNLWQHMDGLALQRKALYMKSACVFSL